ncbi:cytosol nonspecific dipeptidase [Histomonas meleagridis]|uniref:cytosol nonspecific dipeptidase n=1 Tax=Histomonas meleagridis TaxID=135588 RepID=UPI0035597A1D|nr:cytosol nonspecific dipeptidase [Histomonas meleagridis]KAH0799227.1 cytosol nonspecific dipeptidase [Histomonas meleagridis]
MEASALLSQSKVELLKQLPKADEVFYKWFLAITEVERPSFHLEKAIETVMKWGKELGADVKQDEAGNVLLSIPATPGKENVPSLVLQGHLDIVAVGEFDNGRVPVKLVDGKLTSGVSTLGADDGIAIATIFAVLELEKTFPHGPLEFLITLNEEVGLLGASKLAGPPFLKSRSMLNLDSEDWGTFITSCAGSLTIWYEYEVKREKFDGKPLLVKLSQFMSGHTGLVIQEGRASALKWMVRLLQYATRKNVEYRLVKISGGDKHNAIPGECLCEVVAKEGFSEALEAAHKELLAEYKAIELKNPKLEITEITPTALPATKADTEKVVNLISTIHHGVIRMHPEIAGLVQTSQSLSVLKFEGDKMRAQVYARTNESTQMDWLKEFNRGLGALAGVEVNIPENEIQGPWPAALNSKILEFSIQVYEKLFGEKPQVNGIHAGLECGCIQNRGYPDLEAISFGPDVHGAHTIEENVSIESASKCWQLTLGIIKHWAE